MRIRDAPCGIASRHGAVGALILSACRRRPRKIITAPLPGSAPQRIRGAVVTRVAGDGRTVFPFRAVRPRVKPVSDVAP
jgi:hypothetical protein